MLSARSPGPSPFPARDTPRPANDAFADALAITSLPASTSVDLTNATTDTDEPTGCFGPSQTAWWSLTPSSDTVIRADTFTSVIPGSYVNVWESTGAGMQSLQLKDCAGYWTSFTEKLRAGRTYYFQVGSFYGSFAGEATLNLQVEPPPSYDAIGGATPISSLAFSTGEGDSTYATESPDDPTCFGRGATVWYVYVPPADMRVEASVQETYPDSVARFTLSAYTGQPGSLTQLDCSDDSLVVQGYGKPHVEFDARAGVPVYFMIGTSGGTEGGTFNFGVQRPLVVDAPVAAKVTVTKDGVATISGTVKCSRQAGVTLYVTLRQVFAGRLNAAGFGQVSTTCSSAATGWSASLTSWPVSFGPGIGEVEVQFPSTCDSEGCQPGALYDEASYSRREFSKVSLKRGG